MKKILIISPASNLTGSSKSLLEIIKINTKFDIQILLPNKGEIGKHIGDTVTHYYKFTQLNSKVLEMPRYFFLQILSAFNLYRIIKSNKIKLIHVNSSTIIFPGIIGKICNIPVIYHIRETKLFYNKFAWFFFRINMYLFASHIVGCCKSVLDLGRLLDNKKKSVIYNWYHHGYSCQPETNIFDNSSIVISSFAAASPRKGLDILLKGFMQYLEETDSKNLILNLYTERPTKEWFDKSGINYHALPTNIRFNPMIFDAEKIYKESNIFIVPSRAEAFSRAIIESMSHGNWVIATDVGGAKELITNSQNGFLIEYSVYAISRSLRECVDKINTNGYFNAHGKIAVDKICNPDNSFKKLSLIYNSLTK
jgi:glycosyltransferase involved in cell wall biosynthesis